MRPTRVMSYANVARGRHEQLGIEPRNPNVGRARIRPQELRNAKANLRPVVSVHASPRYHTIQAQRVVGMQGHEFTDFARKVRTDVAKLDSGHTGSQMLQDVHQRTDGRRMVNQIRMNLGGAPLPDLGVNIVDSARTGMGPMAEIHSNPHAYLNHSQGYAYGSRGSGTTIHTSQNQIPSIGVNPPIPSFVTLGHEMVHANRAQMGIMRAPNIMDPVPFRQEEIRTVGLTPYLQSASENSIRYEHGLPPRPTYTGNPYLG